MGLLDRLREMIGGAEQPVQPAAGAGQARAERLAAMRAEARTRRRKDMRERLAALITPSGELTGALVRFVNLAPIADAVGAERWAESFPRIELMCDSVIEREIGGETLHIAHGSQGFLLLFTRADMEGEAADHLCDTVFDEIRRLLLGEGAARRPSYEVDTRILLRMLDENTPFPFLPSTRPERETRSLHDAAPSAAEATAAAAAPAPATPPAAADAATDWAEWSERSGAAAPLFGRSDERPSPGGSFAPSREADTRGGSFAASQDKVAGAIAVGRSGERAARDIAVGSSSDRAARDLAVSRSDEKAVSERVVGRSGEQAARDIAVGRSEEKVQRDPAIGRSDDRPGGASGSFEESRDRAAAQPGWFAPSSDRAAAPAGDFGRSEDRPGDPAGEWGMTRDRATQEWFFGRTRRREEIESEARYVPMGRGSTMFAAIEVAWRPFLEAKRGAVTSYGVAPSLMLQGNRLDAAGLIAQGTRYNTLAALDLAVLDRAMIDITAAFERGTRFMFLLPLSFATLMRRADRHAFFDRWATVPLSVRKFARFHCYEASGEIGDTALQEIAIMLRFASREPVFAISGTTAEMRRLALLRARAMMLDIDAAPPERLAPLCQAARQAQLSLYLAGTSDRERRRNAFNAGSGFVEGSLLADLARLPPRPAPVSVAGFIDEG